MSRRKYTKLSELTASEGLERFRRNDSLVHRKLLSYLPFMIATNLATLLLSTVDGVVVGNLVGSEALSAVSIFMPITFVISIVCTWVASGISTALSTGMGDNRIEDLAPLKKAAVTVIGYATLPVFAFLLSHLYAPLFWLAYLAAESLLFLINAAHYAFCVSTDMQSEVPEEAVLYLTVPPEDAIEASQCIRPLCRGAWLPEAPCLSCRAVHGGDDPLRGFRQRRQGHPQPADDQILPGQLYFYDHGRRTLHHARRRRGNEGADHK